MRPDTPLLELAALQSYFLELGFARFKLPERVQAFAQLPRNSLGKVQRFVLQEAVTPTIESEESTS
ncbi:MAG: hypothetical protein O7F73_16385 [Gammaproteobacteria bacterium]|nr:hypothetical protein [Gammaproteobacteria bacterium]